MEQASFVHNVAIIVSLVVLEGLLSADNALVLAILVRHLPKSQQSKALKYGIFGAFFFRFWGVIFAAWLVAYWQFKAVGAGYLLYLAFKHFLRRSSDHGGGRAGSATMGFWKTVAVVELTDIAFSVDSIVAAVAMSDRKWVIYTGGVLGIITMRFVAGVFLRILERFPRLETAAYMLVAWIGIKLGLSCLDQLITGHVEHGPYHMPPVLFWTVMVAIFVGGLLWPAPPTATLHLDESGGLTRDEKGSRMPAVVPAEPAVRKNY
ncbi:MAG: TerC family protein [Phycisphaerae bacterium]|nr:TerC family protein [Phycisphaerae bacterium]